MRLPAYILTLGEALHVELARYGVDVAVLSPGLTVTEMSQNMPINFKKIPMFSMKAQPVSHLVSQQRSHSQKSYSQRRLIKKIS